MGRSFARIRPNVVSHECLAEPPSRPHTLARRLPLRGKQAARAQWRFQCAVHNLLKLHRAGGLAILNTG